MIKSLKNEKWKEIKFKKGALQKRYSVSSLGRVASYSGKFENGSLLKHRDTGGYPTINVRPFAKSTTLFIHKLVGEYFLSRKSSKQKFVIHLDHNKKNNEVKNLRWAGMDQMIAHQQKSPAVIRHKKEKKKPTEGHKLSIGKVRQIKQMIGSKNRKLTLKQVASKFKISEMQLYRIKSGENWGHVKG
ncbi:MAG: NUMOD4 domain-containing protein [Flavobacteriales bacterium]